MPRRRFLLRCLVVQLPHKFDIEMRTPYAQNATIIYGVIVYLRITRLIPNIKKLPASYLLQANALSRPSYLPQPLLPFCTILSVRYTPILYTQHPCPDPHAVSPLFPCNLSSRSSPANSKLGGSSFLLCAGLPLLNNHPPLDTRITRQAQPNYRLNPLTARDD